MTGNPIRKGRMRVNAAVETIGKQAGTTHYRINIPSGECPLSPEANFPKELETLRQ